MTADLKPYSEYKASNSQWLGRVPSHWEVKNLRTLIRPLNERNRADLPLLSVAREKGVFVRSLTDDSENHNVIPEDLSNYKVARAGSLVINKMKAWQGSMGIAPVDGIVSPAYYVYDFAIADRLFGQALLRSKPYVAHFAEASDGVRVGQWDLSISGMRDIPVLIPPPSEQSAIARFLASTNGRLERAIRSKRKVIALLNEQKQAIINLAVSRGLDPKVSLKASGVPWLGDIPAHWELRRLKSLLLRNDGGVWGSDFTPDGTVVLRSTEQAVDGSWQIISPAVIRLSESQIKSAVLEAGDIVVTKSSGSATHIGKASLVSSEVARMRCCYSNFMQRLRTNAQLVPEYLHLYLNSNTGRTHYQYTATSTTGLGNLTRETIATLPIPLPQPSEQLHILDSLKRRLWPLNESLSRLEREIDLLIEYRTSLVADVVTGKLDVRQAAANLPDETTLDTPSNEDESDYIDNLDEEASE